MRQKVTVSEVGPRDGLQIAKTRMETDAKVPLDPGDRRRRREGDRGRQLRPATGHSADGGHRRSRAPERRDSRSDRAALVPNLRGVQNAYDAGVHKISIPVSVSEGHSMANLNRIPAEQSIR